MSLVSTLLGANNYNVAPHILSIALALLVILLVSIAQRQGYGGDRKRAPEAGGGWPIIGHLHLLSANVPLHRILGKMADQYGPIFSIRLGRKPTLIVSSWEIAKECFGTNDKVFLGRPHTATASLVYEGAMFGFHQRPGQYWQNIRRICSQNLLSTTRLDLLRNDKSFEVSACIKNLFSTCHVSPTNKADMSDWCSLVSMGLMTRMIVGERFDPTRGDVDRRRFVKSTEDLLNLLGKQAVSDVIPFTKWIDMKGHFNAVKNAVKECDYFISGWVEEHVRKRNEGKVNSGSDDFLDVMFSMLENDSSLSHPHSPEVVVKATILNLIIAVESTTTIMSWALSFLVNHPKVVQKIRNEIDAQVGKNRWVEESDVQNLPHLIASLKETLRLMISVNVPRESTKDCTLNGYYVPKGTILIANLWKLHRDPRVWSNPEEFRPERFLSDNAGPFNVRDKSFVFFPFMLGRRSCPGATLAMQTMSLVIGRVLQGFDLGTLDGENVDMREGLGLTNPRATKLELILKPRLSHEMY